MISREIAIAHLMKDGNLRVLCSRYGHDTEECAPVAYELERITSLETGEGGTLESLDYAMGLVVNDHDDVAYMLENYGWHTAAADELAGALNRFESGDPTGDWWGEVCDREPHRSMIDLERTGDDPGAGEPICLVDGSSVVYSRSSFDGPWIVD